MIKYLLCNLDDENYADPQFGFYDSLDEAKFAAIENSRERLADGWWFEECKEEFDYKGRSWGYRMDLKDEWSHGFEVNQIIPVDVNNGDYLLVWYHAYDGVDFFVKCVGTEAGCEEMRDEYVSLLKEEIEDAEIDDSWGCIVCDTGNEWEMLTIVKF